MRHLLLLTVVGLVAVAESLDAPLSAPAAMPTCHTTYIGPPGGGLWIQANWTNGIPRAAGVACFPPEAGDLAGRWPGVARIVQPPSVGAVPSPVPTYVGSGGHMISGPPGPTDLGPCCLGSTCVESDAFDCRVMDGYFRGDIVQCEQQSICMTGACCTGDPPACIDEDGAGDPMDEAFCDILGGDYLGGAQCDATDPCQRFRRPNGFESIEVTPGMENLKRRHPHMNNCGEVVFHIWLEPAGEVFYYDNGVLTQVTNSEDISDIFPDINDDGTIVWGRGAPPVGSEIVMLRDGKITVLDSAPGPLAPRINTAQHVVWDVRVSPSCPEPTRDAIYFYDGVRTRLLFDDGLSNQSPAINDQDEMAWTNFRFPCDGGFGDWTSEIILYSEGLPSGLPSSVDTPQLVDIDNQPRVAWSSFDLVEIWEDGITTPLTDGHIPALNDSGDVAFQRWMPGWQLWVFRKGVFYPISKPEDFNAPPYIENGRPDINEPGEIAWWWLPNGGFVPSGIRFMQRIRDGDVNFDGVVDIDDFIPLPGCWTGPVATDGLCECRFYDMDHDRDIDEDDFSLFTRVYTGPQGDCNGNTVLDLMDIIGGTSSDCNLNGFPDECDIASGTSQDADGDGVPNECCARLTLQTDTLGPKNRFLTFIAPPATEVVTSPPGFTYIRHAPAMVSAIRVRFVNLPSPFDTFNGQTMWVGQPQEVCENSAQGRSVPPEECAGAPGLARRTFMAASLVCDPAEAYYTDWSELGPVHIYHEIIVPGGSYELQTIADGCGVTYDANYSAAFPLSAASWGDVVDNCAGCPCGPPDGGVNLADLLSLLAKFGNTDCAPTKTRADLQPAALDFKIDIRDLVGAINAFRAVPYPFVPPSPPCP